MLKNKTKQKNDSIYDENQKPKIPMSLLNSYIMTSDSRLKLSSPEKKIKRKWFCLTLLQYLCDEDKIFTLIQRQGMQTFHDPLQMKKLIGVL